MDQTPVRLNSYSEFREYSHCFNFSTFLMLQPHSEIVHILFFLRILHTTPHNDWNFFNSHKIIKNEN